ncbi:MAG: glucose-6-phosphate dehydrogenase [Acidimicrobiia bacterium]|nr:glucose-6-phosphate dehydrogenase [Acidimicrobiia bacterium]
MPEPHVFVIFGGTGDLARRKLLPAMYRNLVASGMSEQSVVLGLSSADIDDADYRVMAREALVEAGLDGAAPWCDDRVYFQQLTRDEPDLQRLRAKLAAIEQKHVLPGNRIFYLALPPGAFPKVISNLSAAGLNAGPGWTRLVIEKPFGRDLESAKRLNDLVHQQFNEDQVYRIDHYLGKETVRNLLAFRFANLLFETSWNRDRIDAVEITVAETLGIGTRAAYYDNAGVVRDMVQNHLAQLLALVAMEAPHSFDADAIRDEKVQLLKSIRSIDLEELTLGQYERGEVESVTVPGYREEDAVPVDSTTPTYISFRIDIDNWRWQGVPFYVRTGKRLPEKNSHVAVRFRPPPTCLFHGELDECETHQNVIKLILQPNEGFELHFDVKSPGESLRLVGEQLRFMYADRFDSIPDAYQTLILDIMNGDQTLFVRADEVEESWRLFDPVVTAAASGHPLLTYPAGTWGPEGRHTPIEWASGPIRGEVTRSPR